MYSNVDEIEISTWCPKGFSCIVRIDAREREDYHFCSHVAEFLPKEHANTWLRQDGAKQDRTAPPHMPLQYTRRT